jgi:hypothetical protein
VPHTAATSGNVVLYLNAPPSQLLDNRIAADLALFRLNAPVPRELARTIHPPIREGESSCGNDFPGTIIGFGGPFDEMPNEICTDQVGVRKFRTLDGWERNVWDPGSVLTYDFSFGPEDFGDACDDYFGVRLRGTLVLDTASEHRSPAPRCTRPGRAEPVKRELRRPERDAGRTPGRR